MPWRQRSRSHRLHHHLRCRCRRRQIWRSCPLHLLRWLCHLLRWLPPQHQTGNCFVDKRRMPRLKKLMNDAGDLTREYLIQSVRFYSSSNVWRLEFLSGIMRPGLALLEGYRVLGMHGTTPQALRGIF